MKCKRQFFCVVYGWQGCYRVKVSERVAKDHSVIEWPAEDDDANFPMHTRQLHSSTTPTTLCVSALMTRQAYVCIDFYPVWEHRRCSKGCQQYTTSAFSAHNSSSRFLYQFLLIHSGQRKLRVSA